MIGTIQVFFILVFFLFPNARADSTAFDPEHISFETDQAVWKKISAQDGVTTYEERKAEKDVVAFRGEIIMPTTIEKIATVLRDEKIRKQWVDALVETKTIEQISPLEQVEYNHTSVPWPFHDRDFVYHAKIKVERGTPRSLLIMMNSVETPQMPEQKGLVRGEVIHSFYYMKDIPGPEPQTRVMIEMALDPKGGIPMWLVNLTQRRWPFNTLRALKKLASDPDLVVPKEIEDYFKPVTHERK
jgi:hypothetical protein